MKICIASALDIVEDGKSPDGLPQRKTIEFYLKQGDHVKFITGNKGTEGSRIDDIYKYEKYEESRFDISYFDLLYKVRKLGWIVNSIKWLAYQFMFVLAIMKSKPRTFDVLYAYEIHSVPSMWLISKLYRIPLVTRFQGTIVPIEFNTITKLKLWQHIIALSIDADLTIMTNDGTSGDRVIKDLRNKESNIAFLVNGIDASFFDVPPIDECFIDTELRIYSCSRLVEWKNNDRNITAMYHIVKQCPNVRLYVIGGGPEKKKLVQMVKNLSLERYVEFVGVLSHEEMLKYIDKSHVYLTNYSLSNFGKTMMEAMASGRLIVASNVGDTASYIKEGKSGYLVEDNDIGDVVAKILYIQSNRTTLSIGENARVLARKLFVSWENRFEIERHEVIKILQSES